MNEIPFGYCHCGCGKKTNLAKANIPRWGFVKGRPYKFLCGHGRVTAPVGSTPPPNPSGLCQCGCGRTTPLAIYTSHQTGNVKGEHRRYCLGHGGSYCHMVEPENPSGLCMCNCGERTRISKLTRKERGYAAGQPENFVNGHHARTVDYMIEDRGYKTPCWIWQKTLDKNGYGGGNVNRKPGRAHRIYYERYKGPIPKGYHVDHLCFITSCVNPDHLEAVPPIVNMRRRRTTKLTIEKVRSIPSLLRKGLSFSDIAEQFGVTAMAVYNASTGRTWKDVAHS